MNTLELALRTKALDDEIFRLEAKLEALRVKLAALSEHVLRLENNIAVDIHDLRTTMRRMQGE